MGRGSVIVWFKKGPDSKNMEENTRILVFYVLYEVE